MSAFDKRVCQWLNGAAIPDKNKQTILHRMNVGISNYRTLELEKLSTVPAARIMSDHHRIDYSLQDDIAKALYRLEDADASTTSVSSRGPLFPALSNNASVVECEDDEAQGGSDCAVAAASGEAPLEAFTFGSTQLDAPVPSFATGNDEGDDIDGGDVDPTEVEAMRHRMMKRQSRNAVSAEPINIQAARNFTMQHVPKSPDVVQRIVKVLESHHLFVHLEDSDIAAVADAMSINTYKRGTPIALKGQSNDQLFVVVTGSVQVTGTTHRIQLGGTFGDVGLMYDVQHTDSYEATMNNTQVCSIDRASYQALSSRSSLEKRERYEGFLAGVATLNMLTPNERLQIADALKTSKYAKGEKLISYGDEGKWFFIIVEGVVDVIGRDANGKPMHVCNFTTGQPIGELELLHHHKAVADCVASTDVVKVAKMTGSHFEKVIGPAKAFLERQAATDEVYTYYRQARKGSE